MMNQKIENIYYRPYPVNIKEEDKYLFDHLLERKIVIAVKNRILKNAYVNYDGHIWKGLNIIKDVSFHIRKNTLNNRFTELKYIIKQRIFKKTVPLHKACWIIDVWSYNYGHFLIDFMQRYVQLRIKHQTDFCILLPEEYKRYDYILNFLKNLKINVLFIGKNQIIRVSKLYIPDYYHPPGIINNYLINELQKVFLDSVKHSNASLGEKRIFITRGKTGKRKIANEDQLIPILEKNNFSIIYLGDLPIIKQIEICSKTEIVVGLHGAGLSNIMFMKKGKVLELRMKGAIDQWSYFELATALGHEYYYLFCEPANSNMDPYLGDVLVDISEFEKLILSIT